MIPTLDIPFAAQLGMSERLHGARRSAMKEGLAYQFQRLVLGKDEAEFVRVLARWRKALSQLPQARSSGKGDSGRQARSDLAAIAGLLLQDMFDQLGEPDSRDAGPPLDRPIAQLFAAVMHCVAHEVAEQAFLPNLIDNDQAPAAEVAAELDLPGVDDAVLETLQVSDSGASLDEEDINQRYGVSAYGIEQASPRLSMLRIRLAKHLRYLVNQNSRSKESFADAAEGEYRLLAEALLKTLPEAIGGDKLSWIMEDTLQGRKIRSEYVLALEPGLSHRLSDFLRSAPNFFTLQPLDSPPRYTCSSEAALVDKPEPGRQVPLMRFRRMNKPLNDFADALRPEDFGVYVGALNVQQGTGWRLNLKMLSCLRDLVEGGSQIADQDVKDISRFLGSPLVTSVLDDAVQEGAPVAFFLPWRADYRGRIYAETPWFSPQRGDLQRALMEFADGSVLDEQGWAALKRHGANLAGRSLWDAAGQPIQTSPSLREREQWADQNETAILDCAANPLSESSRGFWRKASKPYQFLAFCLAYADARKGRHCHAPVQIDGSCNGLQHIAALTGDVELARAVNVQTAPNQQALSAGDSRPNDVYTLIAERARERLPSFVQQRRKCNDEEHQQLQALSKVIENLSDEQLGKIWNTGAKQQYAKLLLASSDVAGGSGAGAEKPLWLESAKKVLDAAKAQARKDGLVNFDAHQLRICIRQTYDATERGNFQARLEDRLLISFTEDPLRLGKLLDRKAAKNVIMTIPYGAGRESQVRNMRLHISPFPAELAVEENRLVGEICSMRSTEGKSFATERLMPALFSGLLVDALRFATYGCFPSIRSFAEMLESVAEAVAPAPIFWKSPAGFPVFQDGFKLDASATKSIRISPGTSASISWVKLEDDVDSAAQRRKLLPNLIHSLDSSHLMLTMIRLAEQGVTRVGSIHDCLMIHPNDEATASRVVRQTFAELYAHEPGELPQCFQHWLSWMELVHQAVHFRERAARLVSPLAKRLEDLTRGKHGRKARASTGVPGAPAQGQQATRTALAEAEGLARQLRMHSLAEFLCRVAAPQLTDQSLDELRWLVFVLQNTQNEKPEEEPKGERRKRKDNVFDAGQGWPPVPITPDPGFDIRRVAQSPYFFS